MSLIRGLKRAFGFNIEDHEEDSDLEETSDTQLAPDSQENDNRPDNRNEETDVASSVSAEIFDSVIELFNNTQPDFVKNCLDTDAQRKFIMQSICDGVRNRYESLMKEGYERGMKKSEEERKSLSDRLLKIKAQCEQLEERRNAIKNEHLSATRQKRALTERVRDLENLVATLEAEKEQFELENRSMLNKLRVSEVIESDHLQQKQPTDNNEQLSALEKELEDNKVNTEQLKSELTDSLAKIEKEINEKNEALQSRDKLSIELREALEHNAELEKGISDARKESSDALEKLKIIDEIETEMKKFESVKSKKNERIQQLKENVKELNETIRTMRSELEGSKMRIKELEADNDSMRRAMAGRPVNNPETAKSEGLEAEDPAEPIKPKKKRGRKPKVKISAIDELIDGSDWLVVPPLPEPNQKDEAKDDDFGYKAPNRKSMPEDDNQLSLW